MTKAVRSELDLKFYRERVRLCVELAGMGRSVPSIKSRLEALARLYQQRIEDLPRISQEPPALPFGKTCDDSPQRRVTD
jgi:hypothetical protein